MGPRTSLQPRREVLRTPGKGQQLQASSSGAAPQQPKKFLGVDITQLGVSLKKFVPLAFIFFCILFNYTILRDTKVRVIRVPVL